ncbi:MAG TPA: hypothetical protein VMX55_09820 [candidate division Zixibacteria bacterium]|nr:hypothetical protein [candidate division Zixibacteria bacterium]
MLQGKRRIIFIIIILIFLNPFLLYTKVNVEATDVKVSTIHSIESEKPTIDGAIDIDEWKEAIPLTVTFYDLDDQSNTLDITVYSLFDNSYALYLGIVIPLEGEILDSFLIMFKTNATEELVKFELSGPELGDGHDLKYFDPDNNSTEDYFIKDGGMDEDRYSGGTDDGTGKCTNDSANIYIEMAIPFNTGDSIGCDIAIDYGDSVDCFLYAYREDTIFSQIRIDDEETEYCELVIEKLEAPVLEEISPSIDADGNVTLEWNNIIQADSYNIYRETSIITDISELTPIVNVVDTYYDDSNLPNNEIYFFVITAVNQYSESNPSNVGYVTVTPPPETVTETPPPVTETPPPETTTQNFTLTTTLENGIIFGVSALSVGVVLTVAVVAIRRKRLG